LTVLGASMGGVVSNVRAQAPASAAGQAVATTKAVGTVKGVSGKTITLSQEGGGELTVFVQDGARVLRVEPGSTDLKNAAPLQLEDLQPGDRILVRSKTGDDGKALLAVSVIAMKKADIAEKHGHEREEWQRHGVGGLVQSVDLAAGTVQIDTSALGANKNVVVNVSKTTVLRRYAPGSVNFDEAVAAPLDEIKVGDQLRARGNRSADGTTLTADEVVSGSFRNIAGAVTAIDASTSTVTVNDLTTKKPVAVKLSASAQIKKLPQPMAQRIAARLKGNSGDAGGNGGHPGGAEQKDSASSSNSGTNTSTARNQGAANQGQRSDPSGSAGGPGERQGGSPDLQQALSRIPAARLADLQKGDAVMIVATADVQGNGVTAITLLAGVEPILQASPNGQSILTPWSLGGAPGGGDGGGQ